MLALCMSALELLNLYENETGENLDGIFQFIILKHNGELNLIMHKIIKYIEISFNQHSVECDNIDISGEITMTVLVYVYYNGLIRALINKCYMQSGNKAISIMKFYCTYRATKY